MSKSMSLGSVVILRKHHAAFLKRIRTNKLPPPQQKPKQKNT